MFEIELASRGGSPLFRSFHILKALWHIEQIEIIGRKELSTKLDIGEGSTRKLIAYLEEKDWANSTKQGISLTKDGTELLESIGLMAAEISACKLAVEENNFAIRLKNVADQVEKGIEQRDEAIKAGASGASTFIFKDRLKFSDDYDAGSVDGAASQMLVEAFDLKENDVLIIGSSKDMNLAQNGAFAAAVLTLTSKK